jgi:adiponectin receptor
MSAPKRSRSDSQACHSIASNVPYPVSLLGSLRILVLSHLSELEKRITAIEMPSSGSLMTKGEAKAEEALEWTADTVEMLRRIRSEVSSHLPDLPFDAHHLEDLLANHFHDISYQTLLDDIRSHLPQLRRPSISDFNLADMQTRFQDVRLQIHDLSVDFSQPFNYLPVLSRHLDSLHSHLSSLHASSECSLPSLPSTATLSQLLDKLLSSDMVPTILHRVDGNDSPFERAARDASKALKKSLNGSQLVEYVDLPGDWRNNPFVNSGYRFIPLHRWPIILLSLFALHNETCK